MRLVEDDVFYGSEDAPHSLDTNPIGFLWLGTRERRYAFCWAVTWGGWWRWRRQGVHNFITVYCRMFFWVSPSKLWLGNRCLGPRWYAIYLQARPPARPNHLCWGQSLNCYAKVSICLTLLITPSTPPVMYITHVGCCHILTVPTPSHTPFPSHWRVHKHQLLLVVSSVLDCYVS